MENARLITETREALEQQTATAEVLAGHQFLARRPRAGVRRDARKGAQRCAAPTLACSGRYDGEALPRRRGAWRTRETMPSGIRRLVRCPTRATRSSRRWASDTRCPHPRCHAVATDSDRARAQAVEIGGHPHLRCCVPLRKDDALLGYIMRSTGRRSGRSPTSRSRCCRISRRRRSSRWRTRGSITETREALEQQTATAEVLRRHQFLARRPRAGVRRDARKGACGCARPRSGTLLHLRRRAFVRSGRRARRSPRRLSSDCGNDPVRAAAGARIGCAGGRAHRSHRRLRR